MIEQPFLTDMQSDTHSYTQIIVESFTNKSKSFFPPYFFFGICGIYFIYMKSENVSLIEFFRFHHIAVDENSMESCQDVFSSQLKRLFTNSPTLADDDSPPCASDNAKADGESSRFDPPIRQSPMSSIREYFRFGKPLGFWLLNP